MQMIWISNFWGANSEPRIYKSEQWIRLRSPSKSGKQSEIVLIVFKEVR